MKPNLTEKQVREWLMSELKDLVAEHTIKGYARKIKVSRSNLSAILNGRRKPSLELLFKLTGMRIEWQPG
jgi:transcriptional regulator with XRE-family HTH domain